MADRNWAVWIAAALAGVPVVAFLAVSAVGLGMYMHMDNIQFMDGRVAEQASTACSRLDDQLRDLPPVDATAPVEVRAERLDGEARLISELVDTMNELGDVALADEVPAREWLRDWTALAAARVAYAEGLRQDPQSAVLREPRTSDGYPVSLRMKDAAPESCRVVDRLTETNV